MNPNAPGRIKSLNRRRASGRKFAACLTFACALPFGASSISAEAITLTKANLVRATLEKPVIAFVYYPCGVGRNVLNYAFADVKGVNTAPLDVTKAAPFSHPDYDLDTVYLIHKGKVLAHKKPDPERDLVGTTYLRVWAYQELKRAGFQIHMRRPSRLLAEPEAEPAIPLNLNRGLIGFFDFESGKAVNSAPSGVGTFSLQTASGNFQIKNGVLHGDGDYFNGSKKARGARYTVPANVGKTMRSEGFTVHLNFRPQPHSSYTVDPERSFGLTMLNNHVQLRVRRGRLLLNLISDKRQGKVKQTAQEYVYLLDHKVKFGEWYGVVIRFDWRKKRAAVLINGRRTQDIRLSDEWLRLLSSSVYTGANFYYGRSGVLLRGAVDNLAIYDRPLSAGEMSALYKKYKLDASVDNDIHPDVDPAPVDLAALNRRLLAAAYDGDLKKARLALVAGANVNVESRGWTPLMFAAYFNRLPLAKLLVSRGADPHVQKDGWNAQELAAFKGHTTVAKFIAGELRSERQCDCQQGLPAYKARDLGEPGRP
jgi:hypothetical protein